MLRQLAASVYGLVAGLRFRARRGPPGTMRAGEAELYYDARTEAFRFSNANGDNAFGGAGGGVTAHTALTALAWTSSGHTGTANRIAAFNGAGATEELEIGVDVQEYHVNLAAIAAGTWTGAASITTLGTIGTGVWQGTAVGATYGGTGQTGYTVGDLLYASTTTALSKLAAGASGYVLTSNGAGVAPSWAPGAAAGFAMPAPSWVLKPTPVATLIALGGVHDTNSTLTDASDASGPAVSVQSTGTASVAFWRYAQTTETRWNPHFRTIVQMSSDITTQRVWVGAISGTSGTTTDTLGSASVCLRFSTAAPDTNWMLICHDGATQAAAVDTGIAVTASHIYLIEIYTTDNGTTLRTIVRDLTAGTSGSASQTSNVVASSTLLRPAMWIVSAAAVNRTLTFRGHDGYHAALF